MFAADDGGTEAGELALTGGGEATVEGLSGEEAEDGVADELELLVIERGVCEAGVCRGAVRDIRAMGKGDGQQSGVGKDMAKGGLQCGGGWGRADVRGGEGFLLRPRGGSGWGFLRHRY